jgi:hypothetical protein
MAIVGDSRRFAVEYELGAKHEGAWMFGKVCFRIGGELIGDFELRTSLRDFLFQIEQGRRDHGQRRNKRFESMYAKEIVELLEGALFGGGGEVGERLAIQEQWARHKIAPEVDVFDRWRIYLVESETNARLLYGRTEPGSEVREFFLTPGECDEILLRACREIGALYEAETDTPLK